MMKWTLLLVVSALVVFMLAAHFTRSPERTQRAADSAEIERCRTAQNDELQELSTRRLMRTACDRMEAEYRKKWHTNP